MAVSFLHTPLQQKSLLSGGRDKLLKPLNRLSFSHPPLSYRWIINPQYRTIVKDLLFLDEKELIGIRANVEALADIKRGKAATTDDFAG
jgi:hypothetical protein